MILKDADGKKMRAILIFTEAIKYVKVNTCVTWHDALLRPSKTDIYNTLNRNGDFVKVCFNISLNKHVGDYVRNNSDTCCLSETRLIS